MFAKILCVDDDPITLMLNKKVIAKAEFCKEIDSAYNGEEALNYFDNLKNNKETGTVINLPEIIFLDLNMPIMGGWEFLESFTNSNYTSIFPKTKVVVLTSSVDQNDIEKSKNYPKVLQFFSKPITTEMLRKIESL